MAIAPRSEQSPEGSGEPERRQDRHHRGNRQRDVAGRRRAPRSRGGCSSSAKDWQVPALTHRPGRARPSLAELSGAWDTPLAICAGNASAAQCGLPMSCDAGSGLSGAEAPAANGRAGRSAHATPLTATDPPNAWPQDSSGARQRLCGRVQTYDGALLAPGHRATEKLEPSRNLSHEARRSRGEPGGRPWAKGPRFRGAWRDHERKDRVPYGPFSHRRNRIIPSPTGSRV